jgi:hypothetical protein
MSPIRSVSVALVLIAGIVSTPVLAQSPWSSSPNAFGGQNFSNGGYTTPNANGGWTFVGEILSSLLF